MKQSYVALLLAEDNAFIDNGQPILKGETVLEYQHFFAAALCAVVCGCSSTDVVQAPLEVTIGQQLIDLKKARDNGVLNASEYDNQRRRLIENVK